MRKFTELRASSSSSGGKRGLLICYAVAGYPDAKTSEQVIATLVKAGADVIEIGIPFSDPLADGPVIQQASTVALSKGMTPQKSLAIVQATRKKFSQVPIVLMTYANPVYRAGYQEFTAKAKKAGVDGFIIPDLPIEEADQYLAAAHKVDLATIFLVSPNTTEDRIRAIAGKSSGFLYLISTYGTTGMRSSFESSTGDYIRKTKAIVGSSIPLVVGFGISKPEHVRLMIDSGADGVIVASAIVNILENTNSKKKALAEIERFVTRLARECSNKER
jgi:tryptophan synthase alpha chain